MNWEDGREQQDELYQAEATGNTSVIQDMVNRGVAGASDALNRVLQGVNPEVNTNVSIDPESIKSLKGLLIWGVSAAVILFVTFKKIL